MEVGKSLSLPLHSIYRSWCRSIDLCLSCIPVQQHCTKGSGLGKLHLFVFHVRVNLISHRWRDSLESVFAEFIITLISCLARSVQPNFPCSKERMSWYSTSTVYVTTHFLADHSSRPDKSSCWKITSFLCSTNIPAHWIPCISSSFFNIPGDTPTYSMAFAVTTWGIWTPLAVVIKAVVRLFTMTTTHFLPVATLV